MDRNTFWGLFLILIILVGSTYLMQPSEAEIKREKQVQDSIARLKENPAKKSTSTAATAVSTAAKKTIDTTTYTGPFGRAHSGNEERIVLENDLIKVNISTKGGRVESVELKKFKAYDGKPLIMFSGEQNQFGLNFTAQGTRINTQDLYFSPGTENTLHSLPIQFRKRNLQTGINH
jgi:YidC/Oxa1 family membrane protein insertase